MLNGTEWHCTQKTNFFDGMLNRTQFIHLVSMHCHYRPCFSLLTWKRNKKSIWFASVRFEWTLFGAHEKQAHSLSPSIQKKTKNKNTSRCDCCKMHKVTHNLLWSFIDQWSPPTYWEHRSSSTQWLIKIINFTCNKGHLHILTHKSPFTFFSRLSAGWWP